MLDELKIGDKYSYRDFCASVKERTIGMPTKKSIKDSVPFSNITYDFSMINGEQYWEERPLEYIFEMDADSPEDLERLKKYFKTWIANVYQEELSDPFIKDYHFVATYEDSSFDDSEFEKSTISVTFKAYPYMIKNDETVYAHALDPGEKATLTVTNDSAHRLCPKITSETSFTLTMDGIDYSGSAGTIADSDLMFERGETEVMLENTGEEPGVITISFYEEVF